MVRGGRFGVEGETIGSKRQGSSLIESFFEVKSTSRLQCNSQIEEISRIDIDIIEPAVPGDM